MYEWTGDKYIIQSRDVRGIMSDQNNNQKYNDLGKEVRDSVIDAINSGDFTGLSNSVGKTVYTVLGDVGDSINKAANAAIAGGFSDTQRHYREQMEKAQETARRYHEEQEAKLQRNREMRAANVRKPNQAGSVAVTAEKFKSVGMVKGPVKMFFGIWGLILAAGVFIGAVISKDLLLGLLFLAFFGGLSGLLFSSGATDSSLLNKAREYKRILGNRDYCSVEEIANETSRDVRKVLKDIRKILARGIFPEGYVDKEGTTFINSRKVYDEYLEMSRHQAANKASETEPEKSQVKEALNNPSGVKLSPEQQSELNIMITDGRNAIDRLHELNKEIPGEAITAKLYKTESLLNDIFDRVKEHPEQMKKCHKLMNYHLPTMLKLVEAYAEYDKVSVPGPDILKAKEEIEKTMDIINEAFTELLNRMFQDSVWDVTADAQVLKTMLTQEGLAKDISV